MPKTPITFVFEAFCKEPRQSLIATVEAANYGDALLALPKVDNGEKISELIRSGAATKNDPTGDPLREVILMDVDRDFFKKHK